MLAIHDKAVQAAILRLRTVGAQFHIVVDDGHQTTHYGAPIKSPVKRNPAPGPKNGPYIERELANVKRGDGTILHMQEGDTLKRFAKNVSAWCSTNWGNGTYMTSRDDEANTVEVLRLK